MPWIRERCTGMNLSQRAYLFPVNIQITRASTEPMNTYAAQKWITFIHPITKCRAGRRRHGGEGIADVQPGDRRAPTMDRKISQCVTRTGISHT